MATVRWLECTECFFTPPMDTLFAELSKIAAGNSHRCTQCGGQVRLRLIFDFALGAGGRDCSVLAAFLPRKRKVEWEHKGQMVGFSPFLVITQTQDDVRSAWLPYWHQTPGDRRPLKYGQFSPHMDLELFVDLVEQARAADFLGAHDAEFTPPS